MMYPECFTVEYEELEALKLELNEEEFEISDEVWYPTDEEIEKMFKALG